MFGMVQPSSMGANKASLFGGGAPTVSAFGNGSNAPATATGGSLFGGGGTSAPASGFGNASQTAAPATGGSLFGGPQPSAPAQAGSLFGGGGSGATQSNLFGQPKKVEAPTSSAPPATSLFNPASTGVAPSQAAPQTFMGQPSSMAGKSLFGQNSTTPATGVEAPQNPNPAGAAPISSNSLFKPPSSSSTAPIVEAKASLFPSQPKTEASTSLFQPAGPATSISSAANPFNPALAPAKADAPKEENKSEGLFGKPTNKPEEPKASPFQAQATSAPSPFAPQPKAEPAQQEQQVQKPSITIPKVDVPADVVKPNLFAPAKPQEQSTIDTSRAANKPAEPAQPQPTEEQKKQEEVKVETDTQKRTFDLMTLDKVRNEWIKHIQKNEREFGIAVQDLQQYEHALQRSLNDIDTVQDKTVSIKKTYTNNLETLESINEQQSVLCQELDSLEKELQKQLDQQAPQDYKDFHYHQQINTEEKDLVFSQAKKLDKEIKSLDQQVASTNATLLATNPHSCSKTAEMISDASKRSQIENMENSLSIFYDSLKWIENAAVELQFSVDQIQKQV